MNACLTPVVVFAFNRPEKVRRLLELLAFVRPSTLLIVVDGPRAGHPTDADRCRQVRRLLERIDWPCEGAAQLLRDQPGLRHLRPGWYRLGLRAGRGSDPVGG